MKRRFYSLLGLAFLLFASCSTFESIGSMFMKSDQVVAKITTALADSRFSEAKLWAGRLGDRALKEMWQKAIESYRKTGDSLQYLEKWSGTWTVEETNPRLKDLRALLDSLPEEIDKSAFESRLGALVKARDAGLGASLDKLKEAGDWEGFEAFLTQLSLMSPPFADQARLAELKAQVQQRGAQAKQFQDAARLAEAEGDGAGAAAKSISSDFDRIASWGKARDSYARALASLKKARDQGSDSAAQDIKRVTGKMQSAQNAAENEVQAKSQAFYAQLGTIFAKVPEGGIPDTWTEADINANLSEAQSQISKLLASARELADKYPDLLDQGTIARLDKQAGVFLSRLETAKKALQKPPVAQAQASAIPVMVGMFNPSVVNADRSRPAPFKGKTNNKPDWWWGLADIPKDAFQDLVVTMGDDRKIGVWARHYEPGDTKPASDLVSSANRFGKSWPVLNAGPKLSDGVYHLEINESSSPSYSGDVTIYKSFLTRER